MTELAWAVTNLATLVPVNFYENHELEIMDDKLIEMNTFYNAE